MPRRRWWIQFYCLLSFLATYTQYTSCAFYMYMYILDCTHTCVCTHVHVPHSRNSSVTAVCSPAGVDCLKSATLQSQFRPYLQQLWWCCLHSLASITWHYLGTFSMLSVNCVVPWEAGYASTCCMTSIQTETACDVMKCTVRVILCGSTWYMYLWWNYC